MSVHGSQAKLTAYWWPTCSTFLSEKVALGRSEASAPHRLITSRKRAASVPPVAISFSCSTLQSLEGVHLSLDSRVAQETDTDLLTSLPIRSTSSLAEHEVCTKEASQAALQWR